MTQKTFVLCADDFGLSPAVSAGILEAIDAGRLSATGCMTNLPSFRPAAGALAARRGRVQAGVHLTLTAGAPLAPCPRLAPEGRLPALPVLLRAGRGDAELRRDIGAEIGRQLDAFAEAFGGAPDFVDGHQHVHALPLVRGALFAELERRGWTGGPWLRDSGDALTRILRRGSSVKKALAVAALTRGFGAEARRRGFATNEGF
ncbi:MAG TPA: ChbG/HpnK family deacetylase, partial [Beijerinckiaceae bacterium]